MDQVRIGKFIAELRKEKNMTQSELSNKLGITDRAISKWENGRGMPDLSLLVTLCEILGVSVNELLSGERLDKKDLEEKFEENIINTIDYTDKKLGKIKQVITVILVSIFIIVFGIVIMFSVDINRMRENKSVVFSTWGYDYVPPVDIKEDELEMAIFNYLVDKGDNELKHYENEKTFVSMKKYLIEEEKKGTHYNVYAWVLTEKYYLDNDGVKKDSSSSIPYKFTIKNIGGNYVVTDYKMPRDGSYYNKDMKEIFPNSVRKYLDEVYIDGTLERLELDIEKQVKLYFHK